MVARVEGAMDAGNRSGRATMPPSTQAELRGPVQALGANQFTVLGQTVRVSAATGWFAARPSGTEPLYKLYAESFRSQSHLQLILQQAQHIIADTLVQPQP